MKTSIARQLIGINKRFYNSFAASWSTSRVAIHKGIHRSFGALSPVGHLLDLGCGDGRVGLWAAENRVSSGLKTYTGADFAASLLNQRQENLPSEVTFVVADMTEADWALTMDAPKPFDSAVCFSALHHIPGPRRRLSVLRSLHSLLKTGARCAISVWQLSHVPRLQKKIRPWSEVGIEAHCVEANDFLVDWKMGGAGLRYVHEFSEKELHHLCRRAGFDVEASFRSDGQTGDMGLYVVLRTRELAPQ